jgi:predicted transcriptional regulator
MDDETELVTLSIAARDEVSRRVRGAMDGEPQGSHITFHSFEVLWKVISPKRLEILRAMAGQGPLAIREVARRVGRDVKAVHGDVQGLLDAGLLETGADGVAFPYAGVHVDFTLRAA